MTEFTGERVIPGLVDEDLLNEHLARYRFAAQFQATRVLDAGCGTGYGTSLFPPTAEITAADISSEALRQAREAFARPGVRFVQASCETLPFADQSFDLIAAFEVIEHLEQWQLLVTEASRVLRQDGVLLVSTPNKSYYAETRAASGPNPYHCHEFEFEEFSAALSRVFPYVRIWTQNHAAAILFSPVDPQGSGLDAGGYVAPENAHFYVAACSHSPIARNDVYAWVPARANLLREREHHIAKLEGELAKKEQWLQEAVQNHANLHSQHQAMLQELQQSNDWAARLNQEIAAQRAAVVELQEEAKSRQTWIEKLHSEIAAGKTIIEHYQRRDVDLEEELNDCTRHLQKLDKQIEEQATQLGRLEKTNRQLRHERYAIAGSKWMRLGRRLRLGPVLDPPVNNE